jgi:hypothetical protein
VPVEQCAARLEQPGVRVEPAALQPAVVPAARGPAARLVAVAPQRVVRQFPERVAARPLVELVAGQLSRPWVAGTPSPCLRLRPGLW